MSWRNSVPLVFVLLLFCSVNATAELSVSIAPKNRALELLELYPFETGELEVTVLNRGGNAVEGLNIRVSVEEPLVIMRDSVPTMVLSESVESLDPGESNSVFVIVKSVEFSQERLPVVVHYGVGEFTHVLATFVKVAESPLEVNARLVKSALDLGEGSKLVLTLKNKGGVRISNLGAELVLPAGLSLKSPKLSIDSLSPGEGIIDREFLFDVDPVVSGEKRIILLVWFEDSRGRHVLERDFFVDVRDRKSVLYFIIAAIVVLVVVALYLKRRPWIDRRPLEQPELKEVEGKRIKEVSNGSVGVKK